MLNNKKKLLPMLLGCMLFQISLAEPIIYKTVKKNGQVVYSDRLPANEKGNYSVLSGKSGILKTTVEKELSKEEVAVIENKKEEDKKNLVSTELQRKKDSALLSTYSNVGEIEKMKKFEVNQIDQSIKSGIEVVANVKDRMTQNQERLKNAPNNKKFQEENQKLTTELDAANRTLDYNKDLLVKRSAKYDEDKFRYEQILKNMAELASQKEDTK